MKIIKRMLNPIGSKRPDFKQFAEEFKIVNILKPTVYLESKEIENISQIQKTNSLVDLKENESAIKEL